MRGAAATGHPLATASALGVLTDGGNAVDAAVAAAYSLCVLQPESCGLGGDAIFTVRASDGSMISFNGSGKSPRGFTGTVPSDGARTATVPGLVRALEDAHHTFARLPRGRLLSDASRLAHEGFPVGDALISAIERQRSRLSHTTWRVLAEPLAPGTGLRQPELADLLDQIAADGAAAFYEGPIAAAQVAVAQAAGAELDLDDLRRHETIVREPVSASFSGARVYGQPPVSQAVLGLMALAHLDGSATNGSVGVVHAAIEAIEAAFVHRDRIADPPVGEALLEEELDIDPNRAARRGGPTPQTHTTAVATADRDGLLVSMVISVFDEFGSAGLVPEGGFFLNNRMMGFSPDPASPNAAAPGKRPVHTLSPMLVEAPDLVLALSTPGADGQVQTLTQILHGILREQLSPTVAIDRPRWRSSDARLLLEDGFDRGVAERLEGLGHEIHWQPAGARAFGAAVMAGYDSRHRTAFAAADLRREAWAGAC